MNTLNTENKEIFDSLGGKSLGKILIKDLSSSIPCLSYGDFQIISIEDLISENFLYSMLGKKVVLKLSGLDDDFSDKSIRGKNTSGKTPRLVIEKNFKEQILKILGDRNIYDYKSIILEEFITTKYPYEYTIHVDGKECIIEVGYGFNRSIFISDMNSNIIYRQNVGEPLEIDLNDILTINKIHIKIFYKLGFNINTEGFYEDGSFKAIQLRDIPDDYIVDELKSKEIDELKSKENIYSRFVQGIYDISGIITKISELEKIGNESCIVLIDSDNTTWDLPILKERLILGIPTLILDIKNGFHLSHRPEFLPLDNEMRNNFYYFSLSADKIDSIYDKNIRVVSDGKQGIILVLDK